MDKIWEETIKKDCGCSNCECGNMKKAILKPRPPRIKTAPKTNPTVAQPTDNNPDDDDDYESLPERCMCNWPKCKRKARWGCRWCSARMCNYHHAQVTDRKVGIPGTSASEIHNFGTGTCVGEEWVWD
tara:strand:- start:6021 stop:6404 length:384 start_codon:yes stop_codon:yes gene_type:complete